MYLAQPKKSLLSSGVLIISFLIIFAIFVEKLELHKLFGFDMKIIRVIQARIDNPNTRIMKFFTFLGSPFIVAVLVALTVISLFRMGRRRDAVEMLAANAAGAGFNEVLKYVFRRRRPEMHRLITAHGYSFPSGHSMGSVIFYGTLSYFLCKRMKSAFCSVLTCVVSVFMVLLTGVSRIYLGVHYPSDVLSGYAAGGAWLSACIRGFETLFTKRKSA